MTYVVKDAFGRIVYNGVSWPMARAALDYLVLRDIECPSLAIHPDTKE